jgi:hypothetical protein
MTRVFGGRAVAAFRGGQCSIPGSLPGHPAQDGLDALERFADNDPTQRPVRSFVVGRTHLECMADEDRRPAVTPKADKGGRVADRIRNARDSPPGMRDALPKGALGGVQTDPQGDENREPPAGAPTSPPR